MKVLGLHGKLQTGEILSGRLGTLRRKSKKFIHFHFIDAPHLISAPSAVSDGAIADGGVGTQEQRTWFHREGSSINIDSLNTSLASIDEEWRRHGPFDGILAFSMGGAMAAIIAASPHRFPGIKFVVTAGSPDIDLQALAASGRVSGLNELGLISISISSMHFAGEQDAAVSVESTKHLSLRFPQEMCRFITHEQGHCFPSRAALIDECVQFMQLFTDSQAKIASVAAKPVMSSSIPSAPASAATAASSAEAKAEPPSAEDEQAQRDEWEALAAIFPDILSVVKKTGGTVRLTDDASVIPAYDDTILVTLDCNALGADVPASWSNKIALLISRPSTYPSASPPHIDLVVSKLSLHDITSAQQASLLHAVRSAAESQAGVACIMTIIQEAHDWLCTKAMDAINYKETPSDALAAAAAKKAETAAIIPWHAVLLKKVQLTDESIDDDLEREVSNLIHELSVIAGRRMAEYRRSQSRPATSSTGTSAATPADAFVPNSGGIWHYTVGLVGKPSAGKSTFFNVATQAALSRDGRLMAAVAPHPFTTIEPNVGPGWWSSHAETKSGWNAGSDTDQSQEMPLHSSSYRSYSHPSRGAAHGRDAEGGRLLPLIVKDVAGLVPGAYKGRGKGNKFLGDLCDADVFVHVVDASGKADKDGNVIVDAGQGSNPMEDARWIHEELHRWIYGNIICKWASVIRSKKNTDSAMHRLMQLFSGYQGPRTFTLLALYLSGLNVEHVAEWTVRDLHTLVAHYLTIRFPKCLALNKIDSIDETDLPLVPQWQKAVADLGEVAVPVCAMAEAWSLLNEAQELALREIGDSKSAHTTHILSDEHKTALTVGKEAWANAVRKFGPAGVSGVLRAISAAVQLRPPVLCYPVSDLGSELPIGMSAAGALGGAEGPDSEPTAVDVASSRDIKSASLRLLDCLQFKPGTTIEDVYEALKRGEASRARLTGEFVRAEGRSLDEKSRRLQLGRAALLDDTNCVLKVQTNRKVAWQSELRGQTNNS